MAEEFDVEAMLEAPFKEKDNNAVGLNGSQVSGRDKSDRKKDKKRHRSRSRSRENDPKRSRDHRRRSKSRERRSKSRERRRSRDRKVTERDAKNTRIREPERIDREKRKSRSRSKERRARRSKSRSKSRERFFRRGRSPPVRYDRWTRRYGRSRSRSPMKPAEELPPEERDQRTVFVMQLSAKVRTRDIEEFFSSVGKVREVRLIMDNKTRRHKGISYVEFVEISSVALALGLGGQKLCGQPIIVQPTQAEKNRAAASSSSIQRGVAGPMRLYIGSLHFNITEDMLKGIFEPFGRIEKIELMRDPETGRSKGYGFITFHDAEDAKKALEQLNGFELAGRPMKVNHVTERTDIVIQGPSLLDSDELDRTGIDLGTTGRLQLMAKLAEGTGIQLPQAAVNALQMGSTSSHGGSQASSAAIATQCFMLTNMFDPNSETNPNWAEDIRNDIVEECRKQGGALHVYVDINSPGNAYVKCPTVSAAVACVNALHGRWFSGRMITAAYVPIVNYHSLFHDSVTVITPL